MAESERGEWKSWLKAQHLENKDHGIWSHHFMGNRWGNSGNSAWLFFWGSKITADGDWSHGIKRCLLLQRKVMTNLVADWKAETFLWICPFRFLCQQRSIKSRLWFFQCSCMDVRVELWRKLSTEELTLLNYGVREDSWESLGLQGDPTSPF